MDMNKKSVCNKQMREGWSDIRFQIYCVSIEENAHE